MIRRPLNLCNWYGPDPGEDELVGTDEVWLSEVHFPPSCLVWVVAEPSMSRPYWDLAIRLAPVAAEIGQKPEWWDDFACKEGYTDAADFLDIPSMDFGVKNPAKVMTWLMQQGIAPGQPFQVAVAMPYWYRCSYEYDEYEENKYAELVTIAPLDLEEGRRRWAWFLHHRERAIAAFDRRMAAERERAATDVGAMSVRKDWFYHGDPQFGRLGGYIALLYSRHGNRLLAEGRDDVESWTRDRTPTWDAALERLIASAVERIPTLTPEIIRALPVRH